MRKCLMCNVKYKLEDTIIDKSPFDDDPKDLLVRMDIYKCSKCGHLDCKYSDYKEVEVNRKDSH